MYAGFVTDGPAITEGAAEFEEFLPGGVGKDRQAGIFFTECVRERILQIALHVHDDHIDIGHVQHKGDDAGGVPDTEIGQRIKRANFPEMKYLQELDREELPAECRAILPELETRKMNEK